MNHLEKTLSRMLWQYRNAEKFGAWVSILPNIVQDRIEGAGQKVIDLLDIDKQSGEQLDLLGRIAGIDRPFIDASVVAGDWFGWLGNGDRNGWGAPWLPRDIAGQTSILMPDIYFRVLIKARIAKNNSDSTIDGIIEALEFITGKLVGNVDDRQDMSFSVVFSEDLSIYVRTILQNFDIVPRPQGVKFLSFSEPTAGQYFGYIGDPNVRPYNVAPYAQVL